MSTNSKVTVTIPSYNYERYLRESVQSAVDQEGVELDVVIVDNASTDDSLLIASEFADKYDCVRVVSHRDNLGIVSSFNRCLDEVRGDYAVMLCADDCLTPGSLRRSVEFMEQNPHVGLVYGPVVHFRSIDDVDPQKLRRPGHSPITYPGAEWIDSRCRVGTNPIRAPEALVRTATRRRAGGYNPACPYTFDLNMWLRIAAIADVAFLPGPPQALYRLHGDNFSNGAFGTPLPDLEQHWAAFTEFFDQVEDKALAKRWRELGGQTMSKRARWAAVRAYAAPPPSPKAEEVDALLELASRVSGKELSPVEGLNWKVQRRIGRKWARYYPPFVLRLTARGCKRYVADRRHLRTGV